MNTIISVVPFVFLTLIVGFILGCVYSDAHWQPIVKEYKKALESYKEVVREYEDKFLT